MKIEGKNYQTIWFEKDEVKLLIKQTSSHKFLIKNLTTVKEAINAIKIWKLERCTTNWSHSCLWISFVYN